jgi:cytochrome c-type biogenesis protein CcmH
MTIIFLALMVAIAIGFILWPLCRSRHVNHPSAGEPTAPSVDVANLEAFRQQRRELDDEHQRGLLSDAEHEKALDELAARLSDEISQNSKPLDGLGVSAKNVSKRPWILAIALSVFVIVGSGIGYALRGGQDTYRQTAVAETGGSEATNPSADPNAAMSDKQIVTLVDNLAKKMQENPNDAKGWVLLARSQNALGQYGAAIQAYERALALQPNDANLLADYADAQAMSQEGSLEGLPTKLIERALKIDANNLKALALAGTAAMRAGNKSASLGYWARMQKLLPPDSDDAKQVAAIINEIKTGKPAFPRVAEATANTPPSSPAPAETRRPESGQRVAGEITIASGLNSKISAGDTLFVFARAKDGPRMPLAVLRVAAPTMWPYTFELTDAMAMAPGMNLSSATIIVIEARISKSGNALPQSGDLGGISAPIDLAAKRGAKNITVQIDKRVP